MIQTIRLIVKKVLAFIKLERKAFFFFFLSDKHKENIIDRENRWYKREMPKCTGSIQREPSEKNKERRVIIGSTTPVHNYLAPNQSTKSIKDKVFPSI